MFNRQFSVELDRIRWIAAFLVVVEHTRNLLFVDFRYVTEKSALLKAFYFFCGLGHQAVIVFFVLSGLLVGGGSIRKFMRGRFEFRDYAEHRFSRIYVVLIPALAVGWLLDMTGILYFNASALYTDGSQYGIVRVFADQLDWKTVLGNALLLQWIAVPSLGSNGPLWSLANEWWYYCIFALLLGAVAMRTNRLASFLLLALAAGILAVLPARISIWFLIWLAGAGVGYLPLRGLKINRWFAYGLLIGTVLWARMDGVMTPNSGILDNFIRDGALAAACLILFTALAQCGDKPARPHLLTTRLAGFSYTLYLVHVPFLVFTAAALNDLFGIRFHRQPAPGSFAYFGLMIALLYGYAYVFSKLTEAHTDRLRHWLGRARGVHAAARPGS
jgi:peptidoglycan/LPS O-acetylase OafA/YrhL